jgi:uncharacterized protein YdaT
MCWFKRRKQKKAQEAKLAAQNNEKAVVVEPKVEEPKPEVVIDKKVQEKVEPKPIIKEEPKPEVKKEPQKEEVKPVPVQEEVEDEKDTSKVNKVAKYHVSQNKDDKSDNFKKWRVRKEGSTKTIKFFDTQKEAIEFAEQLAESAGSSVVIHKVDGSIRKQDYAKKE